MKDSVLPAVPNPPSKPNPHNVSPEYEPTVGVDAAQKASHARAADAAQWADVGRAAEAAHWADAGRAADVPAYETGN